MDNKLEDFLNNKDYYFIHYACDGFYNGSSPAPKISCIVIYNDSELNKDKKRFSPMDYLEENDLESAERLCLEKFKQIISNPSTCFIHWNMNMEGFGFKAISARAKDFGIDMPEITNDRLFDLSSYVAYLSEKRLSIKQVLWFNSLLNNGFLDGKTEAQYAKEGRFEEIFKSINAKVVGLSMLIDEIKNNTLKTENPFPEPKDGLTKEERRALAQKVAESRERMFKEIEEHNRRVLEHNKRVMEQPVYQEVDEGFLLFDSDHPLLSLFANWFINK